MSKRVPGERAPEFELKDQDGRVVRLADLRGRKVLLYFFPKADTPGCTTQACTIRDAKGLFERNGITPFGISPDPVDNQKKFEGKHHLNFRLLSDPDHQVALQYGAWGEKTLYGRSFEGLVRSAFLIDAEGRITHTWYKVKPQDTVKNARAALGIS